MSEHAEAVARLVAAAPPLSAAQLAQLAVLLAEPAGRRGVEAPSRRASVA